MSACDKFIYTEVLRADNTESKTQDNVTGDTPTAPPTPKPVSNDPPPLNLIASVIEDICGEEDWANLGTVGQHLNKRKPDFDTRLYGHQKLSDMMRAYPKWFQIKKEAGKGILVKALRK